MTIKINDKEYKFEFRSQLGVLYLYEQLFGTCFQDDVNELSAVTLDIRYSYSVLTLSNKDLDFTFEEFLQYVEEDTLAKCRDYILERTKQVYQLGKNDTKVESNSEDGTKKA